MQVKVLHVITGLNVGGAEAMLARLLDHERSRGGVRAQVATLMPQGVVGRQMAASGVVVHQLGMRGLISAVPAALRLARLIGKERPDVVVAWMHHAQLASTLAVLLAQTRTPVVWNVRHSLGGFEREKWLTRLILKLQVRISRMPTAIIYNSRAAAAQYSALGFAPVREHVIPNGLIVPPAQSRTAASETVRSLFGIPPHAIVIGMIARAHPMKDVGTLLCAFSKVQAAGVAAHLLLVGEGMDHLDRGEAQLLAALPKGSWTISGHRTDVGEWLAGIDTLALSSAWGEGFPNIVGEAMAQGVPCVGTDVGDTGWIIGTTGRTVPPRNPAALAEALIELARMEPEERMALGEAARRRVEEHFTLDHVAVRYGELYRDVANARTRVADTNHASTCEAA
ncbi:glycosyl transferase family 1 [Sphingobium sp. SCG-1]|nr:glycosyl transferase family 1 [Sphingobium sp. SCG-1]